MKWALSATGPNSSYLFIRTAPRRRRSASGARACSDLHPPLDVRVDEIRAAVDVVEDLRHPEDARAVAGAETEIGLAQLSLPEQVADADVDGRIAVLEQFRGVPAAHRLVPRFDERHALRVREAAAEADARAHAILPGKSPLERLQVEIGLPEIRLEPALLVSQQAPVPGDRDGPAVQVLDERPPDLEGVDGRAVVGVGGPAAQLHDRQQVAGARSAVQDLEGERGAIAGVFFPRRNEVVA